MKAGLAYLQKNGKALAAKGVKPVCPFQQVFQSLYLFGAFSAITGDHFMLEMPNCNAACFQAFLDEFSKQNCDEFKVMVLDNGAFHKTKSLNIPENIALIFLPPYSPELKPAEKMWAKLKRKFTNRLFNSLEMLSDFICDITKNIENVTVKSTCAFSYIFEDQFLTIL